MREKVKMPRGIYKRTKEIKARISKALTGRKLSKKTRNKMSKSKKNHIVSNETRLKIGINSGDSRRGLKLKKSHKENISKSMKGKIPKNIWKSGKEHPNYIDGRSKLLSPARYGDDWDKIRYLVYLRDKFTCQDCGVKGISLDIHHRVPFLISFDNSLGNLVTLCRSCHMKSEAQLIKQIKEKNMIGEIK